jgi:hypothetical protein
VRIFRQKFTLEDAIGIHACSLEANTRVTNGIPLGSSLFLPVCTVNCVQTLKVDALLKTIFTGLAGMCGGEYPQLAQRAGRTISEIFAGIGQFWETAPGLSFARVAQNGVNNELEVTISAAQVELDQLFFRTLTWFFSDPLETMWPFVAELPFHVLSAPAAWRVLCLVFTNGQASLGDTPQDEWRGLVRYAVHRERFADRLMLLPQRAADYLLITLANLARSRDPLAMNSSNSDEKEFVEAVFFELFAVACLNAQTREAFLRCIRDQLATVASAHPFLLSTLIRLLQQYFARIGKVAIYVLKAMPLNLWQPTAQDLLIVHRWLEEPLASAQHLAAREVLDLMDIEARPADHTQTGVQPDIHMHIAFAVATAFAKHATTYTTESWAQTSGKLIRGTQSPIAAFEAWCWKIVLVLEPWRTAAVDVETSIRLDPLRDAFKLPVVAFVVLSVSTAATTHRAFADHGVHLMECLLTHQQYSPSIAVLKRALPRVVLDAVQPAAVASNPKLVQVLQLLLQADQPSLAGDLLFTREHTIERLLVELIRFNFYGAAHSTVPDVAGGIAFEKLVEFWLQFLCSCDGWFGHQVARRLLDVVLAAAFAWADGRVVVQGLLERYHADAVVAEATKRTTDRKGVGGVLSWISNASRHDGDLLTFAETSAGYVDAVLPNWLRSSRASSPIGTTPMSMRRVSTCLIFESLVMETRKEASVRQRTGETLLLSNGTTLEASAKALKQSTGSFRVYRWAHYCSVLDPEESLLPLFWQMFFHLYFTAGSTPSGQRMERRCFGHLFFKNDRIGILETLKQRLSFLEEWHAAAGRGEHVESSMGEDGGEVADGNGGGGAALNNSLFINVEEGSGSTPTNSTMNNESVTHDDVGTLFRFSEWSATRVLAELRPVLAHQELAELYKAMRDWLDGDPDKLILSAPSRAELTAAGRRLFAVIHDSPWKAAEPHTLWRDLLPRELDGYAQRFRDAQSAVNMRVFLAPPQAARTNGGGLLTRKRSIGQMRGVPTALTSLMDAATINQAGLLSPHTKQLDALFFTREFEQDLMELSALASLYATQRTQVAQLDASYQEVLPTLHVNDPVHGVRFFV